MRYSPRFGQTSEQLMQKESRTSGELLLPVSRRPSHWDLISQRNTGAPFKNLKQDKSMVVHMADSGTGIVLLDTDPYHAMKTPPLRLHHPSSSRETRLTI